MCFIIMQIKRTEMSLVCDVTECYYTVHFNTVMDVVCSVSLSEAYECSFPLGTGSQQE